MRDVRVTRRRHTCGYNAERIVQLRGRVSGLELSSGFLELTARARTSKRGFRHPDVSRQVSSETPVMRASSKAKQPRVNLSDAFQTIDACRQVFPRFRGAKFVSVRQ